MVRLENGDGGEDSDSLCFYVAITLPQIPLSEIDGTVNLFSTWRAKERHLIFDVCWRDMLAGLLGVLLCRDRNLFCALTGNDHDKMLLT